MPSRAMKTESKCSILNRPDKAAVFSSDGLMLETTMDDIELSIASRYLQQNLKYMED